MAIVGQKSKSRHVWSGDDWYTYSTTINFAPSSAHAQVCLTVVAGDGPICTGITAYRHRPNPNGQEFEVTLSDDWWKLNNIVGVIENMTSVTLIVTMSSDNEALARIDIYFWE